MTDGYYLSTLPPLFTLGKPKGISVILESLQYADSHNSCIYKFLFIQRTSRDISVVFPAEFSPHITMV